MVPEAEVIKVLVDVLQAFPCIQAQGFEIRISHATLANSILDAAQVPVEMKPKISQILTQSNKLTWTRARKIILNLDVPESVLTKLENLLQLKVNDNGKLLSKISSKLADSKIAMAAIKNLETLFRRLTVIILYFVFFYFLFF